MNLLDALILGLIEGLTEFLPISSTAHLIISSKLLGIEQTDFQKFFEVFIQSGAILSVLVLYARYLTKHKEIVKKTVVSFLPTAVIGFFLFRTIKNVFFESDPLILSMLVLFGFMFLLMELMIEKKQIRLTKTLHHLSYKDALIIGFLQAVAVIPGVSRAGIVLIAMMFLGYRRHEAAVYSFLLAIPTIFAASAYDLYKSQYLLFNLQENFLTLSVGLVTAFIAAYVAVGWFVNHLKTQTLHLFGYYRIALAIILLTFFFR